MCVTLELNVMDARSASSSSDRGQGSCVASELVRTLHFFCLQNRKTQLNKHVKTQCEFHKNKEKHAKRVLLVAKGKHQSHLS